MQQGKLGAMDEAQEVMPGADLAISSPQIKIPGCLPLVFQELTIGFCGFLTSQHNEEGRSGTRRPIARLDAHLGPRESANAFF